MHRLLRLRTLLPPHWGNRCAMCLRCYHSCPRNAVAYGKATAGKGRYMAPKDI